MQTERSLLGSFKDFKVWSSTRSFSSHSSKHKHKHKQQQWYGQELFSSHPTEKDSIVKRLADKMGKSNKFDYTNRGNSGEKLGQIISAALLKEAEKVKKDADRHQQKARKRSTDSTGGSGDSSCTIHIIDLAAPNKDLGDEGVRAMSYGFSAALNDVGSTASLALEDLNLAGNGLTAKSLKYLSTFVQIAKLDLKTLNLADNKIKVETDEEAALWESFLRSFKYCMKLRRVDFSGNEELGSRALEIFARVHKEEPPIDPTPPGGELATLSFIKEDGNEEDDVSIHSTDLAYDHFKSSESAMIKGRLIKRRCGLRSIPYITFHNVGLDNAAALWLSFVVEDHYYPLSLIDELNATSPDTSIKAYQQDSANMLGIGWTDQKFLDKEGRLLLEKTEIVRRQHLLDDGATQAGSELDDTDSVLGDDFNSRLSADRRPSLAILSNRRASIRSIRTTDGGEHEVTELERARKKIMRHMIAHDGAGSVELWGAALRVFKYSRNLFFIAPQVRTFYTGEATFKLPDPEVSRQPAALPPAPIQVAPSTGNSLVVDVEKANAGRTVRPSYASRLLADEPELALKEVTNTPATPLIMQHPSHRKGALSEGTDNTNTTIKKFTHLALRDCSPDRFVRYQHRRIAKAAGKGKPFRDTTRAGHLPMNVVESILGYVVEDKDMEVMSVSQRAAVVERGHNRETLTTEMEWLKKDESSQILLLLDAMNCLAYGS